MSKVAAQNHLPLKCVYTNTTTCESRDNCWPEGCFYPDDLNCLNPEEEQPELEKEEVNKTETTEVQTEKVSFFARIINFFKNLFT